MTARSFPEPLISLASGVLGDFRRLLVPLAWFELVFKGVVVLLGFAGGAGLLAILMHSTGTSAVTNSDIVEFLLTPVGVVVVATLGLSTLLCTVLEHLGVMAIAARFQRGQEINALGITRTLGSLLPPLLRLKAASLALLALTAAPLALLGGLTYAGSCLPMTSTITLPIVPRASSRPSSSAVCWAPFFWWSSPTFMFARSCFFRSSSTRISPPGRH